MAIRKQAKEQAEIYTKRYMGISLENKTDTGIVYALISTIRTLKHQNQVYESHTKDIIKKFKQL